MSTVHTVDQFKAFLEFHPSAIGVAVPNFSSFSAYARVKVSEEDGTLYCQV